MTNSNITAIAAAIAFAFSAGAMAERMIVTFGLPPRRDHMPLD